MKSHPQPASPQLSLPLVDRAPTGLPQHEQQGLALSLVELLFNAATPSAGTRRSTGGQKELEAYE